MTSRRRPTVEMNGYRSPGRGRVMWTSRRLLPVAVMVPVLAAGLFIRSQTGDPAIVRRPITLDTNADRPLPSKPTVTINQPRVEPQSVNTADLTDSVVQVWAIEDGERCGWGSGTAVLDGEHVLTNYHVIGDDENCQPTAVEIWRASSPTQTR